MRYFHDYRVKSGKNATYWSSEHYKIVMISESWDFNFIRIIGREKRQHITILIEALIDEVNTIRIKAAQIITTTTNPKVVLNYEGITKLLLTFVQEKIK